MRISRKRLQELYQSMKSHEVCTKLKITMPTLLRMLKMSEIPLKGKGNRWPRSKIEVF